MDNLDAMKIARSLRNESFELNDLAACFEATGNERMADKLSRIAQAIDEKSAVISRAISEQINADCEQSREMMGATFGLALAVATGNIEVKGKKK